MSEDENKPKVVSITTKTEKLEEDYYNTLKTSLLSAVDDLIEKINAGQVEHVVIIHQAYDDYRPMMSASGDSSDSQLYKMYHYLAKHAADDYNYGIEFIKGELDD